VETISTLQSIILECNIDPSRRNVDKCRNLVNSIKDFFALMNENLHKEKEVERDKFL
jgi:hypothetical protein